MSTIRVLVVEDSAVTREYLVYLLTQDPAIAVLGTARNGQEAVEHAEQLKPDVILMDIHMPKMNGYDATREIMIRTPTPIIVISASFDPADVAKSFAALEAGALTVLEKPEGAGAPRHAETAGRLIETVKLMADVKVVRRWRRREIQSASVPGVPPAQHEAPVQLVGIGASTGGPPVIAEILRALPAAVSVPILLAQHIAPGFVTGLAEWLGRQTPLRVKAGEAGEPARPGTVYIAPDGAHMGITADGHLQLTREPTEDGFCPSVSHLLRTIADAYGRCAVGVLLTGMGRDGALGLHRLRQAGGVTIVQDEESCVVFGMPGEAVRLGAAQYTLAPPDIARTLRTLIVHR